MHLSYIERVRVMEIEETKVVGYRIDNGDYIVFVKDTPKIIGRGKTPEEALDNLNDAYASIIRAIHSTVMANPQNRYG